MFFCDKCGSIYEISNDVKYTLQQGGNKNNKKPKIDIAEIIRKILDVEESKDKDSIFEPEDGIEYLDETDILSDPAFTELDLDQATTVINKLNIYLPKIKKKVYKNLNKNLTRDSNAYFVCINCTNFEQIKPGTIIFSQSNSSINNNIDLTMCRDNIYDMTLPRDRNYTCPNNECPSHKDPTVKEEVTKRYKNNNKLIHTCCACQIVWST
jgi:hypothetical protein